MKLIPEYEEKLHPVQVEIYRSMSAERKLEITNNLYCTARELKTMTIRDDHPDWTEDEVRKKVREIFLYARA